MSEYRNIKCWPFRSGPILHEAEVECIRCTRIIVIKYRTAESLSDKLQNENWYDFGEGWECEECCSLYHWGCCGGDRHEEHGDYCPRCS